MGLSAARVSGLQTYSASLRRGRTGRQWVVDGRGLAVAGPDQEAVSDRLPASLLGEVLGGKDAGFAVYDDEDSVRQVVRWSRAGTTGWIALGTQEEEFAGPLRSASQRAQALVDTLLALADRCVYADKARRPDRYDGVLRVPVTRRADVSTPV